MRGDVLRFKARGHHHPYHQDRHAPTKLLFQIFKIQVVQECLQLGVSIASVALQHGINANLVRKWIAVYRDHLEPALPRFSFTN
jgi:hypothetical protein